MDLNALLKNKKSEAKYCVTATYNAKFICMDGLVCPLGVVKNKNMCSNKAGIFIHTAYHTKKKESCIVVL